MALSFTGCGDFFLEDAFLPPTCDDVFYPNPEKLLVVTDQDANENHESKEYGLIATTHSRTTRSLSTTAQGMSHHRSPEAQQRSFHLLLRTNLNRFNQRLSMLESNTLDMKKSLESMKQKDRTLISQMKTLVRVLSPPDRTDRVNELAKKYTNIETKLGKLEHKLEILIDGFTALAQEIDKVKRERRISRPHKKASGIAPTTIPALTTPREKNTSTSRPQRRTVSPKTCPAPHTISTLNKDSQSIRNSSKQAKSSSKTIQPNQEIKLRRKDIGATANPDNNQHNKSLKRETITKNNHSMTSDSLNESITTSNGSNEPHHVLQNNKEMETSEKQQDRDAKEHSTSTESQISGIAAKKHQRLHSVTRMQANKTSETKFQILPPAHTKIPQLKESVKSSKPQVHIPIENSYKPKELVILPSKHNTRILVTKMPSLSVQTKRINPNKTRTNLSDLPSHEDGGTGREPNRPEKEFASTTVSSKPATNTNAQSPKPRGKITTRRKSAQRKSFKSFNILDIFIQNNKRRKRPRIKQDENLHIVVGRLAIPVKILPDY